MDCIDVPFLYAIDHKNVVFDDFSDFNEDFFVQSYERTSNSAEIDGKFTFRLNKQEQVLTCECKNRAKSIGSGIRKKILEKSTELHHAKVSFVFCRQFVEYTKKRSELLKFIKAKRANIYCIEKHGRDSFKVVPFSKTCKLYAKPRLNCIIFEFCGVNMTKIDVVKKIIASIKRPLAPLKRVTTKPKKVIAARQSKKISSKK